MKVIDNSLVEYISGGLGGNTGDYRSDRNKNSRGAPDTCTNQAGVNGILGAMAGIPGGPPGIAAAAALASLSTAVSCSRNGSSGGRNQGAFGGNNNSNSVNGQCRR